VAAAADDGADPAVVRVPTVHPRVTHLDRDHAAGLAGQVADTVNTNVD